MDVNSVFPTSIARTSETSARQSSTGSEAFEQVMDQARSSAAAQNSPKTGAPAPKPLAQRPAAPPPAKAEPQPPKREPVDKPASTTEPNPSATRPASDKSAAKDGEVRSPATDTVKADDALAPPGADDSAITLAPIAAPEIAPVAPLPTADSPAAQQIALIAQALGLHAEATEAPATAPAPAAPALAAANATATPLAPAAAEASATAKLAGEFAALVHAASGDEVAADTRPAATQANAPIAAASPTAAPVNVTGTANPAAAPALPAAPVHASPGQPAFAGEFGNRVMLMAQGHVKSAQIALNPGELGPVEVRLELRGQEASLVMSAAHPGTRAALEDALPRLREMFAAQGLELADAQVGAESRGDPNPSGEGKPRHGGGSGAPPAAVSSAPLASTRARGLVDTFA